MDPSEVSCPVCMELLDGDIYTCRGEGGHNVCGSCYVKMTCMAAKDSSVGAGTACPMCRGQMETHRNTSLKRILQKCRVRCSNVGCEEECEMVIHH